MKRFQNLSEDTKRISVCPCQVHRKVCTSLQDAIIPYPGGILVAVGSTLGFGQPSTQYSRRVLIPRVTLLDISKSIRRDIGGVLSMKASESAFHKPLTQLSTAPEYRIDSRSTEERNGLNLIQRVGYPGLILGLVSREWLLNVV